MAWRQTMRATCGRRPTVTWSAYSRALLLGGLKGPAAARQFGMADGLPFDARNPARSFGGQRSFRADLVLPSGRILRCESVASLRYSPPHW